MSCVSASCGACLARLKCICAVHDTSVQIIASMCNSLLVCAGHYPPAGGYGGGTQTVYVQEDHKSDAMGCGGGLLAGCLAALCCCCAMVSWPCLCTLRGEPCMMPSVAQQDRVKGAEDSVRAWQSVLLCDGELALSAHSER
eukprot:1152389-Pelagomonas_calceolata.AAC.4